MSASDLGPVIEALFFDGRSARGRPVRLAIEVGCLVAHPVAQADPLERWPLAQVQWPERTRHGKRVVHLAGGGQFDIDDVAAFDAWRAESGAQESWVVRAQQHWRATAAALVLLLALLAAGYRWGVPWIADVVVDLVPHQVDRMVGEAALENLRARWLTPSRMAPARQQALRDLCTTALAATVPPAQQRPWTLSFHSGGTVLGANAFALPDGSIVITDELVALLEGQDDALVGVFGHEYGHVHLRHGMRAVARFALVSTATSVALGDFSSVLAGLPALLAQLGYSRGAEREADQRAALLLVASGRRPEAMVVLFERLTQRKAGAGVDEAGGPPIALASHPLDEERKRFFREFRR